MRPTASKGRDRLRFFLLFALTACDVGRLPWSCSTSNPPAGLADEKKLWTPDLFDSYSHRSYKQKSSGRQPRFQCENRRTGSEEIGHREEWLVSLDAS